MGNVCLLIWCLWESLRQQVHESHDILICKIFLLRKCQSGGGLGQIQTCVICFWELRTHIAVQIFCDMNTDHVTHLDSVPISNCELFVKVSEADLHHMQMHGE